LTPEKLLSTPFMDNSKAVPPGSDIATRTCRTQSLREYSARTK
jgi:hypothetical protein